MSCRMGASCGAQTWLTRLWLCVVVCSGPKGEPWSCPSRAPDSSVEYKTTPNQALYYRLNGDTNPLHADPSMAAMGGFDRPILHGLCFYGIAGRVILKEFCDNDTSKFKGCVTRQLQQLSFDANV